MANKKKNKLQANQKSNQQLKVSQTLVIKPPARSAVGIDNYRTALRLADRGRRYKLVEVIKELMDTDPVLAEAWDKRVRAITNAEIVFQIDGKEVEPMMDLIDTTEFEDLLSEIMLTIGFGKSVIELGYAPAFKIQSIDRSHLNTDTRQILINPFDTDGVTYEDDEFLLNLGKDEDLGLFLKIIPYAIFKRNGGADYAQYCELFGIPQLAGLYDPDDDNARQEMEEAFERRGSAGSVVMSKNGDIKTIGAEAGGTNPIHKDFLKWCDEQILIGIIGQTMTTKDGSSYSQGAVHMDTENDINKSDRRFVQRVLNEMLLPRLEKRGYPVKGGWFSFVEKEKALTKKEQLEIAKEVDDRTEHGIDENYWYENFGLPKGERKKEGKESEEAPEVTEEEKQEERNKKKDKGDSQKLTVREHTFWQKLKDFFANAPR